MLSVGQRQPAVVALPILTTNTRSTSLFLGAFAKLRGGERRGCSNRQYLHPALVGEWETLLEGSQSSPARPSGKSIMKLV